MKTKLLMALLPLCAALPAAAADRPSHYAAGLASYVLPDSVRADDDGAGGALIYGVPLTSRLSAEFTAFGHVLKRESGVGEDAFYGAGVDLRYLLGGNRRMAGFLVGGLGGMVEDFDDRNETSPYLNLGAGLLVGLSPRWRLRGEARYYNTLNEAYYPDASSQGDVRLGLGLQYSFASAAPVSLAPVDTDGDGVLDLYDLCPGTPPGTEVDGHGCPVVPPPPADSDGDGVPDHADRCPGTPPGVVVDATGCPIDDDGDGVPNDQDACPGTPPGFRVDARGCVVEEQTVIVLTHVNFEFNSARLTRDARVALDRIVAGLQGQPGMVVEIGGHTDSIGSAGYNQRLSEARAASVRQFLLSFAIDERRLHIRGYGQSKPIASNDTDEGRAQNRRVEFTVLSR